MKKHSKTESRNNRLAVTAPCGTVDEACLQKGIEQLRRCGYTVSIGESCYRTRSLQASDDRARSHELAAFLLDPLYSAVLCARGGYGAVRLLPHFSKMEFQSSPRLFGYSDTTVLHAVLGARGVHCFHAPMVATEFGAETDPATAASFFSALSNPAALYTFQCCLQTGRSCRGITAGGNLTMLASLCGSGFLPDFRNALLLLEDINEPLYKIDRALMQLALSGVFHRVRAVLLGSFTGIRENLDGYFQSFFADFDITVATGLQIGHQAVNLTLPLGCQAVLEDGRLTVHT